MSTINIKRIRHEIAMILRSGDVISTSIRGVTTTTDTPTVSASQTVINLANGTIRNIRAFTVDGTSQTWITDYSIDFSTGIITMTSGFSGGESVSIQYDHGGTEKIYPDFPRDDLKLSSYPRIGVAYVSGTTESFDIGGASDISSLVISIFCLVPANKDTSIAGGSGGTDYLSDLLTNVRSTILSNNKSFSQFPFIRMLSGPNPITYSKDNKVMMQSQDCMIQFLVE